jgi:hypothetical protein
MVMNEMPIHTSPSVVKSLWQEYRIYADRVEFDTHFGKMTVPFEHVEDVRVAESDVRGLLRGNLQLKNFRPALKLDWANFREHIVLDTDGRFVQSILFTPEDVEDFHEALVAALDRFRAR